MYKFPYRDRYHNLSKRLMSFDIMGIPIEKSHGSSEYRVAFKNMHLKTKNKYFR